MIRLENVTKSYSAEVVALKDASFDIGKGEFVFLVGPSGSGKSTQARALGAGLGLPVVHIDHIHWQSGWVERDRAEKQRLVRIEEAREAWVIEGGLSSTWDTRLARAEMLVWVDRPWPLRLWRVLRRSWRYRGQSRPDLPEGCPETFGPQTWEFVRYILRTRHSASARMGRLMARADEAGVPAVRLASDRAVAEWLAGQGIAAQAGLPA